MLNQNENISLNFQFLKLKKSNFISTIEKKIQE